MGNRNVMVEIQGQEYPLCMTIAALGDIAGLCGGIENVPGYISSDGSFAQAVLNTAEVLGILLREGEENRRVCAQIAGQTCAARAVPDAVDLPHIIYPGEWGKLRGAVLEAISKSMEQTVEAAKPKNAEDAAQG